MDPATIHPRNDPVQLAECVVGVLRFPETAADRVERHAESIAVAVGENLLDVGSDFAAHCGTGGEERVVGRGGTVIVQSQDDAGKMGVVGGRSAECVVDKRIRKKRAVGQILEPAAPALVAHEQVEFAVGTKPQHAAVVIPILGRVAGARMSGHGNIVGLAGAQLDQVPVENQVGAVPDVTIDAVAEQRHLGDDGAVRTCAALRPAHINEWRRRKVRMQHQAQEASLGGRIHCEVKYRRRLQDAANKAFYLP